VFWLDHGCGMPVPLGASGGSYPGLLPELERCREKNSRKLWSVEVTYAPCNGTTQAASSTGSVYLQQ